jgi:hypothetical protein
MVLSELIARKHQYSNQDQHQTEPHPPYTLRDLPISQLLGGSAPDECEQLIAKHPLDSDEIGRARFIQTLINFAMSTLEATDESRIENRQGKAAPEE